MGNSSANASRPEKESTRHASAELTGDFGECDNGDVLWEARKTVGDLVPKKSDAMHHSSTIRIDFRMCAAHTRSHMSKLEAKVIDAEFLSKCLSTRKGEH
ncbi:hypothetical protein CEXT_660121 [Caerostris extrusa]|uniref:Uncharacterized protein n=1 Tax=Caerostris extrusa TaxID=172846 RepID=A0AAV4N6G0_CAEEX|nr:hypothetical protein CEXT_660121 [Caerostris extrusa]